MFERKSDKLISRRRFLKRIFKCGLLAVIVILVALVIGILGYHHFAKLGWIDSLLNASMILGGMGPVNDMNTDAAKIFASIYALFSGLVLISAMGFVMAPLMHRVLHNFHMDERDV